MNVINSNKSNKFTLAYYLVNRRYLDFRGNPYTSLGEFNVSDSDGNRLDKINDYSRRPLLNPYEIGQDKDVRELKELHLHIPLDKPNLPDILDCQFRGNLVISSCCFKIFQENNIVLNSMVIPVDLFITQEDTGLKLGHYKLLWSVMRSRILDMDKSIVKRYRTGSIATISYWAIKKDWIPDVDLFCASELPRWIASERLRHVVLEANLGGFDFKPVDLI